jgi:hypothetical protein
MPCRGTPSRHAARSALATAPEARAVAAPGHGHAPFRCGSCCTFEHSKGTPARQEKARRWARIFWTNSAPIGTPIRTPDTVACATPRERAGRIHRAEAGSLTPPFLPHQSEPRSGRHKTPPRLRVRQEPQAVAASAPSCDEARLDHADAQLLTPASRKRKGAEAVRGPVPLLVHVLGPLLGSSRR